MKHRLLTLLTILFLFQHVLYSQAVDFANNIKEKTLKQHVYVLASDSCAGRSVGTDGIAIARDYILGQLKGATKLQPYLVDDYLQPFQLLRAGRKSVDIETNGRELTSFGDYMYYGKLDDFNRKLPIAFAGYGKDEDFENLDIKGKAVFILNKNLRTAFTNSSTALKHGAELCLVANPENLEQFESISRQFKTFSNGPKYILADKASDLLKFQLKMKDRYMIVSSSAVKNITANHIKHWRKASTNPKLMKEKRDSIGSLTINIQRQNPDTIIANNIVSFIPGTNQEEYLVVGAHYDHLGMINNEIYHGADDNASGTAALIEIAKAFAKAYEKGYQPKKNILFVAFSAEEGGLWGSTYFVNNFQDPERIKLMLNIDMIGRCDQKHEKSGESFYFIGNKLADSIKKQNEMLCKQYRLVPDYSSTLASSDNKPFSNIGIPTIFYFDGKHEDLHKPTDTRNKIDYKQMTKISRVIFETIWTQAEMEHPKK